MKKSKYSIILVFLILIIGFSYFQYRSYIYEPIDKNNDEENSFIIKKGESVKEIGLDLEENGLISSDMAFYLYTKIHNLGEKIIAGRFFLKKSMNVPEIIQIISDPAQAEFMITIQEGLTVKDIDQKLVDLGLIKTGEFINEAKNFSGWEYYPFLNKEIQGKLEIPVEGFLYPDTYFLDPTDFKPHDMIYIAMDNFEKKVKDLQISSEKMAEIITMASIIEKEVFGAKDRKIISGILWKRLENDWTIGADATLLYVTDDRTITAEDLEMDSPYNTRKFKGLPPGPISNPSLESIEAALNPEESEYWFYLTTPDTGEVIYAETNEEQNLNKEKYL